MGWATIKSRAKSWLVRWHAQDAGTRRRGPRGDQVRGFSAGRDAAGHSAARLPRPGVGEPALGALGTSGAGPAAAADAPGMAADRDRAAVLAGVPIPRPRGGGPPPGGGD